MDDTKEVTEEVVPELVPEDIKAPKKEEVAEAEIKVIISKTINSFSSFQI